MILKDLISKQDYDYISIRLTPPPSWYPDLDIKTLPSDKLLKISEFMGAAYSKEGNIYPLDGDVYSIDDEVLAYETWKDESQNIKNGLTIVTPAEWMTEKDFKKNDNSKTARFFQ